MIKKLLKKVVVYRKKKRICKNAIVGNNIQFATSSGIVNTGCKENVKLGNHGCSFGIFQALCGGKISVGDNFFIGSNTYIQSKEKIEIGDNVIISDHVLIVDNNNHPTDYAMRLKMSQCDDYMTDELWTWKYADSKPIVIKDNVWIGKSAVIMKGVTIGKGSIVALGSIVTHDIPDYCIAAGNPAKVIKKLERENENTENEY